MIKRIKKRSLNDDKQSENVTKQNNSSANQKKKQKLQDTASSEQAVKQPKQLQKTPGKEKKKQSVPANTETNAAPLIDKKKVAQRPIPAPEAVKEKQAKVPQLKTEQVTKLKKKRSRVVNIDFTAEELKKKIEQIQSNESISKTGKKRLSAYKKKLQVLEASSSEGTAAKSSKKSSNTVQPAKAKQSTIGKSKKEVKSPKKAVTAESDDEEDSEDESAENGDEEQDVSQEQEEAASEDEEQEPSDDEEDDTNDDEEEAASDDEEQAASNDEEQVASEDEEQAASDEEEQAASDDEEQEASDDEEQVASDDEEEEGSDAEDEENNTIEAEDDSVKAPKQKKNSNATDTTGPKKTRYVFFVGNVPYNATPDTVRKHFLTRVSSVVDVRIPLNYDTKASRGFAYVEVSNSKDYEKGLSLHQSFLDGRKINVQYSAHGAAHKSNWSGAVAKNKKLQALRNTGRLAGGANRGRFQKFGNKKWQPNHRQAA